MEPTQTTSMIEQLLSAVSWDGRKVSRYRSDALQYENVLTAQVLQGLDFLPRHHFLGAVLEGLRGQAVEARRTLVSHVEEARLALLSGSFYLRPSQPTDQTRISVQPDGILESPAVFAFIEAKRPKDGTFQPEQLAREFVVVTREAQARLPLLLLILGEPPPIRLQNKEKRTIRAAIMAELDAVLAKTEACPYDRSELAGRIDSTVVWTTWQSIGQVVAEQLASFKSDSPSIDRAIARVAHSVLSAINRHG